MSPLDRYLADQAQNGFIKDDAQYAVIQRLNELYEVLEKPVATAAVEKKRFFCEI